MRRTFSIVMIFLYIFTPVAGASSDSEPQQVVPAMDADDLENYFDVLMNAQMQAIHVPGGVVSVVRHDTIVFAKGYGYADLGSQKPVEAEGTLFRLASVSKLFVWTAVMQLVEQGKLDLDADINVYLNDFKIPQIYSSPITLLDLMNHTAGFEERSLGTSTRHPQDVQPLGKFLASHVPAQVFAPGKVTAYSNYGTALAGYIVSQVSAMSFEEYVEKNIFDPLDMEHSTFRQPLPSEFASSLANGYAYLNGKYEPQNPEWAQLAPAASLSSTANDMANFMIAHLQRGRFADSQILQQATAMEMHRQSFTNDPRVNGYAHGFSEATINGQRLIGHTGDILHYHSGLFLLPEYDIGLFISFNGANGMLPVLNILRAFMDRYFPDAGSAPVGLNDGNESATLHEGVYFPTRTEYTTAGKMVRLFQSVRVEAEGAHQLVVSLGFPAYMTWHYMETAPGVFRSVDESPSVFGEVIFDTRGQNRIHYLFFQNNPGTAYVKAPWFAEPVFNLALLSIVILLFASVLVGAPIAMWIRRRFPASTPGQARWASWWQAVLGFVTLLFLTGFILVFSNPQIVFGLSAWERLLFLLPLPIGVLVVGMVGFTFLAWTRRWWSFSGRLHYTLVTLAGLAFTWWLVYWNLWIGFLE
jgi:CubicO group peptidase (beta-lactamase class C family)